MTRSTRRFTSRFALACALSFVLIGCASADKQTTTGKAALQAEEIKRLKRDIQKVDKSIAVTKELVNRSKGERYLPDLYFRLAELHIEKSRLVYFRILEEAGADDKSAVVAPEARLLKDQAIAIYRRILSEHKDYPDNDKITFFIAHEYRELGNFEEMIKTYEELVSKFPKSQFRFEAWLILGDYHFDRGEIDNAMAEYKKILANPETYAHNMARYKTGWCWINKDNEKKAVSLWEEAVRTPTPAEPGTNPDPDAPKRLDVRREALKDLAFYYAEARDPRRAIPFFEELTKSREEYQIVLEKLARRFQIKTMFQEAADVYRELISISADLDRNIEWAQAVYDASVQGRDLKKADSDVKMLAEISARYKYWWRASDEDKKALLDFEQLSRDLATKLQALAKERADEQMHARAADAYKAYLSVFDDSPEYLAMQWNYAEALYASKQYVRAGVQYEEILRLTGEGGALSAGAAKTASNGAKKPAAAARNTDADRKQAMYSAIVSYFEALKRETKGTRFHSMMAREGIKDLGGSFVAKFPTDTNTPQVKFNVARAYYEQALYDDSIKLFNAFVKEHPRHKDSVTAAELVLDAYAQKEDFSGLANAARDLQKVPNFGDAALKGRFAKMAEQAEQEEINRKTIAAEGKVQEVLASFIVEKQGTEIAAKALYQAFVIARDRRNFEDMLSAGRQLIDGYADSEFAKEVLPALAEQSLRISQVEQAAAYYEEYSRRFPKGQASDELLEGAAMIRLELGEYGGAVTNFERLTRQGAAEKRTRFYALMAQAALEGGDWRKAESAASQILEDPAHGVLAGAIVGEAAIRAGDLDEGAAMLMSAIQLGKGGQGMRDGKQWLGRAQYVLGEAARKNFEQIQFGGGNDGEVLQAKFESLQALQGAYIGAIQAGDPEWAMGALYRIAAAYSDAADFLDNAPVPGGLTPEEEAAYKTELKSRADPLRQQGKEALEVCRSKAKQLEAFNRFVKACVAGTAVNEEADRPKARPRGVQIPGRDRLEKRLMENPRDMNTLISLIRAAIGVGDFHLGRQLSLRALEFEPKNAAVHNLLGVATTGINRHQEAAAAFKAAIKRGRSPEAYANLGALYKLYGHDKKADQNLGRADGVSSNSPDVIPEFAVVKAGG
jgi:tetratricopeptide (TPR) repeat protein